MGKAKSKSPAFQFYPDKFLAGTEHLSHIACRSYMRILCYLWLHTKSQFRTTFETKLLRRITKLSQKSFDRVWAEIQQPGLCLFATRGKNITSNGLRKEAEKQKERSEAAKVGANARWDECKRNTNASDLQCSLTTTPSPSPSPKEKIDIDSISAATKKELDQIATNVFGYNPMTNMLTWMRDHKIEWVYEAMRITEAWVFQEKDKVSERRRGAVAYMNKILMNWASDGYPQQQHKPKQEREQAKEKDDKHQKFLQEQHEIGMDFVEQGNGTFEEWVQSQDFSRWDDADALRKMERDLRINEQYEKGMAFVKEGRGTFEQWIESKGFSHNDKSLLRGLSYLRRKKDV